MSAEEREELGRKGRGHVDNNFNFEDFKENWINFMLQVHEEFGSWDTRKNYKSWESLEVK